MRIERHLLTGVVLVLGILALAGCSEEIHPGLDGGSSGPDDQVLGAKTVITFAVFGDTHSGDNSINPMVPVVHPVIKQNILNFDPDYVFHVGDIVQTGGSGNRYTGAFDSIWNQVVDDYPFYPAMGNHDNQSQFLAYFDNPPFNDLPPLSGGKVRYTLKDPVAKSMFIVLDVPLCNPGSTFDAQEDYLEAQLTDPANDALVHRFVFWHHPPFTLGFRGPCLPQVQQWDSLMAANEVDIVFTGHTHGYERHHGMCNAPGQSPVHYIVTGRTGAYEQQTAAGMSCAGCSNCVISMIEGDNNHNYVRVGVGVLGRISVNVTNHLGQTLDYFQIID